MYMSEEMNDDTNKIGLAHTIQLTMYSHIKVILGLQTTFAKAPALRKNKLFSNYGMVCMGHSYNIMVTKLHNF